MCPICHVPSISLPRHQFFTLCGELTPCFRRRLLHRVPSLPLQYSTSAAAFSGVPLPRFTASNGSVPICLHHIMNSFVPNLLVSNEFQARSSTRGRFSFGPTPSSQ